MKQISCPRCSTRLTSAVREGVDVDICRDCLGVWFDRGEVEKVFHRLSATDPADLPSTWEPFDVDPVHGIRALVRS